ncbi:MAG: ABC transporter ATP-binding protein [Dinoroseobacter sp.]|nr:ABC transporter ATP-binding protein [Dinoroseobacter sp.]
MELEDIEFAYPTGGFRLQVPNLVVAASERVAVVGSSGTGKTTLLNLVAGILKPDRGSIHVAGTDLGSLSEDGRRRFRASNIGFVFQDFALLDYLNVQENILYPYRITPALKLDGSARERAKILAEACGLSDKLDRHPGALSQGEKQRVAICRSLVTRPRLVISDEATGNLDPENKALILDLLFEQAHAAEASVLAVTHDHALLPRFDRVVDFASFRTETTA